jgi:hypothetical protein
MKRRRNAVGLEEAQRIRFAWLGAFFATVALIAILGLARSAQAMTVPLVSPTLSAVSFVPPEEDEEEEFDGEEEKWSAAAECEEAAESEADEEECEAVAEEEAEAEAPRECVLSSANATVTTATNSDKVRLAIRYTAYSPGAIQVVYFLRGKKGPLQLGSDRSHLGAHGVIRDTDTLTTAQIPKALAARNFTIQLRPASAPRYCDNLLDRHLTVRANISGRLTWSDPGPTSTASRLG